MDQRMRLNSSFWQLDSVRKQVEFFVFLLESPVAHRVETRP